MTLAFPHDQNADGDHAALASLLGVHTLDSAQFGLYSTVAWAALLVCLAGGLVNWRLCVRASRRGRHTTQHTT
jgi:hypothetical protein